MPLARIALYTNGDFLTAGSFFDRLEASVDHFVITEHGDKMPPGVAEVFRRYGETHPKIRYKTAQHIERSASNRGGLIPMEYRQRKACGVVMQELHVNAHGQLILWRSEDFLARKVFGSMQDLTIEEALLVSSNGWRSTGATFAASSWSWRPDVRVRQVHLMGGETAVDRVAIVGCGAAGAAHAGTVARCGRTELVSCCDVVPARSTTLSTRHGGRACTDLAGVLGERPDIVIVATGPLAQPDVVDELVALGFRRRVAVRETAPDRRRPRTSAGSPRRGDRSRRGRQPATAVRTGGGGRARHDPGGCRARAAQAGGYAPDATVFDWGPHVVDMAVQLAEESPVTWGARARLDTTTTRRHAGLVLEGGGTMGAGSTMAERSGRLISGSPAAGQPLFRVWVRPAPLNSVGCPGRAVSGTVTERPCGHRRS